MKSITYLLITIYIINRMLKGLLNCKCAKSWGSVAPLVLRVIVGLSFALHGWQKVQMGNAGVAGFFTTLGIPAATFFAFVVTWVEFLGGIALILGILTHWVSKALLIDMLVAIFTAHLGHGFFVNNGGPELALLLAAGTFSLMITGPGKWALMGGSGCADGCCTDGNCNTCCKDNKCSGGVCKVEPKH